MRKCGTVILLLFISLVFCVQELSSVISVDHNGICYAEDMGEDGKPVSGEEDDSDEKSENDLLFASPHCHAFDPSLVAEIHFSFNEEFNFSSPYYEIYIPPPEMA